MNEFTNDELFLIQDSLRTLKSFYIMKNGHFEGFTEKAFEYWEKIIEKIDDYLDAQEDFEWPGMKFATEEGSNE